MRRDAGRSGGSRLAGPPGGLPGLLDAGPERDRGVLTSGAADQLAALVARAANAPVGLIYFVQGDHLRLYGGWGLSVAWDAVANTENERSLAGVVIDIDGPLVIDDVRTDERVPAGSPILTDGIAGAYIGHPVRDRTGTILGICCAFDRQPRAWTPEDVTSVAEAAQVATLLITEQLSRYEIDQQRRFLDAVLDSLHDGVTACDAEGRVVFVNERMRRLWGESFPEGLADGAGNPLSRDDMALFRALRGDDLRDEEVVLRSGPARHTRHYLVDAHPIVGPGGSTAGAVQAVQDVTRRRRVERFRTCELAVTKALADAANIAEAGPLVLEAVVSTLDWVHAELWLVDETSSVIRSAARWSAPGWQSDIDVPAELPFGQGLAGRAWQAGKPLWIRDVGRPQSLISPETAATSRLHAALAIPIREGFESLGVLTAFTDTVEEPEDELLALMSGIAAHIGQFVERRVVEDLQRQLNRSKNEYLALIGHELRTPLTSISAYTELLREADEVTLVTDGPRLLEVIERNTSQLRHIINELLELSALDAGHADVQLMPMDLAEVVRDSLAKAREAVNGAPLLIEDELPDELVLHGDRKRLRQVVDNLLGNAVKYSPDGGRIAVTLRVSGRAAELAVSDSGADVPADEREMMFTGLYRTSRARDAAIPGTGLGLTLSRAVVTRHHGSIELVEQKEQGSTVVVRLPMDAR
ncbi:GAF domain-containing protein [Actinoplanes sp. TBRC 11911]|uniref:sensor histidine kinase n=1 Tax=Actinoplanes sp. TBRC 11911 TaxID=2729386 RepID=UPI00145C4786|nr:PAS domain-containing sensor histidine kinase [Actinoplanes sp. TBRC 11911]NMO51316.1 GAF domain-containing protein [Actinoplanes sp. TBRC 11911]